MKSSNRFTKSIWTIPTLSLMAALVVVVSVPSTRAQAVAVTTSSTFAMATNTIDSEMLDPSLLSKNENEPQYDSGKTKSEVKIATRQVRRLLSSTRVPFFDFRKGGKS